MGQKERQPSEACLHAVVHGRVQGVSFRYYAQRRGRELGLAGYVRNLWDGAVEVVAEGPRPSVESLLAFLRVGPRAAFVTGVDVEWTNPSGSFDGFEVRY